MVSAMRQTVPASSVRFLAGAVFAAPTGVTPTANGRHSTIQLKESENESESESTDTSRLLCMHRVTRGFADVL